MKSFNSIGEKLNHKKSADDLVIENYGTFSGPGFILI